MSLQLAILATEEARRTTWAIRLDTPQKRQTGRQTRAMRAHVSPVPVPMLSFQLRAFLSNQLFPEVATIRGAELLWQARMSRVRRRWGWRQGRRARHLC